MNSPVSPSETIAKANRIQGMVRSIDQYRNCDPKAIADGSYAQILYALTDDKNDILVLWGFAVSTALQLEAMQREMAELREALKPFADYVDNEWTDAHGDDTPGPVEMIQRIVDRFETLNLLDEASKDGRDQDGPVATTGFDRIVAARKAHVDAVSAYNARHALAQSERARGNWSIKLDAEYRTMSDAQRDFIRTAQEVADAAIKPKKGISDV